MLLEGGRGGIARHTHNQSRHCKRHSRLLNRVPHSVSGPNRHKTGSEAWPGDRRHYQYLRSKRPERPGPGTGGTTSVSGPYGFKVWGHPWPLAPKPLISFDGRLFHRHRHRAPRVYNVGSDSHRRQGMTDCSGSILARIGAPNPNIQSGATSHSGRVRGSYTKKTYYTPFYKVAGYIWDLGMVEARV